MVWNAKLTLGQTEHKPAFVLPNFPYQAGATNYTLEKFKLEDNTTSSTVVAMTGNNGNWEAVSDGANRNTDNDDYNDSINGKGLDTGNGTAYLDLATTNYDNDFFKTGSVLFKVIPQFGNDDATDQTLFHCYIDANNYLHLFYDAGDDEFHYTVSWGGTVVTLKSGDYTGEDAALQIIQNIRINHDSESNKISLEINGQVEDADTNTGTPSTSNPTKATVGAQQDRSTPGDYILLDIQSFNSPINCFGAFFTGNSGTTQLADGMYHKDILTYTPLNSLTSATLNSNSILGGSDMTVTGTVGIENGVDGNDAMDFDTSGGYVNLPGTDNINLEKGSLSFWFKSNSSFTDNTNRVLFGLYTTGASGDFAIYKYSNNYLYVQFWDGLNGHYIATQGGTLSSGWQNWNHYRFVWNASATLGGYGFNILQYINGMRYSHSTSGLATAGWVAGTASENYAIGTDKGATANIANGIIDEFYITNNPNTPQIPCAGGVPLDVPLVRND